MIGFSLDLDRGGFDQVNGTMVSSAYWFMYIAADVLY